MTDEEYRQRTEQRIDSLLEVIDELRQGMARKDAFIELMEPYMSTQEAHYNELTESMQELVRAYRKAREGDKP